MSYQVEVVSQTPEKLSRGLLILRLLFGGIYVGIPHYFLLFFRLIAMMVVSFIAWWAVLFTGKYPKGMFDFVSGTCRWINNVGAYLSYHRAPRGQVDALQYLCGRRCDRLRSSCRRAGSARERPADAGRPRQTC